MEILNGGYLFNGKNLVRLENLVSRNFQEEDKIVLQDSAGPGEGGSATGFRIGLTTGPQYESFMGVPLFYRLTALRKRFFENESQVLNDSGELGVLQVLIPVYWGLHVEGGATVLGVTHWFDSAWPMTLGLAQQWSGKAIDGKDRHSPDILPDWGATSYHMIHAGITAHNSVTNRAGEMLCQPVVVAGEEEKNPVYQKEASDSDLFASCQNRFRSPSGMGPGPEIADSFRDFYFGLFGRFHELTYDVGYVSGFDGSRRRVDIHVETEVIEHGKAVLPFIAYSGSFLIEAPEDPLSFVPQDGFLYSIILGVRFFFYPESEKEEGNE